MSWTAVSCRQAGLILRAQLTACGVPASTVDSWLLRGRLEATGRDGVYRVAGAPDSPGYRAWSAALGTRSPVTFVSAARWWDMPVDDDGLVHITRVDRRRLDWPPGVRVHRVAIRSADIERRHGLWVTTRRETVLDCIGWLPPGRARVLADRALQQRWIDLDDLRRRLEERPGRWGNRQIRRLAARLGDGADAESERRLHAVLRRGGLSGWTPQFPVVVQGRRFIIDVAFPAHKIAIEVDGYAYHSADGRFQHDRTKQNALIAAGWTVLRFTWIDVHERPAYVIAAISQVLAARPDIA